MKKKITILIIIFLVLCFVSCKEDDKQKIVVVTGLNTDNPLVGNIQTVFPLTSDETDLNIMITGYEGINPKDVFVWKKYEEMTGVKVKWNTVSKSSRVELVNTSLMNGTNLDLIMRCKISPELITKYGQNDLLLDLNKNDILKKYAPNCWKYLQSHPDALASVTNPDGAIYSLPQVNSGAELRVSRKIFINQEWLDNVNMEIPQTTEELYEILKAFKEKDANGNGNNNDEIPFGPYDWTGTKEAFFGAFGLMNRGLHNSIVDYDENNNKIRFIASAEEYKHFLEYFNKLYTEGLIDESLFSVSTELWTERIKNNQIGAFASTNLASVPAEMADKWIALDEALEGPDGDKLWTAIRANFHSAGAAVIPSTCKNPELVLRWLDYFWTDEGTLFYHMGIENETFIKKEDGTFDYMPFIYDEIKQGNKSFDDVVAKYSPYPGGSNPTVEIVPYFMGGEVTSIPAKASRNLIEYGPNEYWPSFTFTSEENSILLGLQSDITKYTSESMKEFIKGTKSFDEWNEYLSNLDNLNLQELLDIYEKALYRYNTIIKEKK